MKLTVLHSRYIPPHSGMSSQRNMTDMLKRREGRRKSSSTQQSKPYQGIGMLCLLKLCKCKGVWCQKHVYVTETQVQLEMEENMVWYRVQCAGIWYKPQALFWPWDSSTDMVHGGPSAGGGGTHARKSGDLALHFCGGFLNS